MKKTLLSFAASIFIISLVSCGNQNSKDKDTSTSNAPVVNQASGVDIEKLKQELLSRDKEFSNYSEKMGIQDAFINYIADNGVILRPNHKPIESKDSVKAFFLSKNKNDIWQMRWSPMLADVAASGEIGYTYGTYVLYKTMGNGQVSVGGTYVTIWKKDKDGAWKFVLNSGNEGLIPMKHKVKQQV